MTRTKLQSSTTVPTPPNAASWSHGIYYASLLIYCIMEMVSNPMYSMSGRQRSCSPVSNRKCLMKMAT